jgi:hypothetical protein
VPIEKVEFDDDDACLLPAVDRMVPVFGGSL